MPAGGARVTTAKQLQGKKGTGKKDLHPESRRVKQAARVELRTKRVTEDRKTRARLEQEKIDRLLWFIREMDASKSSLTMDELHEVAQRYLSRLDGQLEEEKKQRRPGRLMSKRQQEIEATKEREERQYAKEGLVLPDLCDEESVQSARYWDEQLQGNPGYYSRIRLVRLFKGDKEVAVEQKATAVYIVAVGIDSYPGPRPSVGSIHDKSASAGQPGQGRRAPSTSSVASSSGTGYSSARGSVGTSGAAPIGRNGSISGGMAAHLETTVTKLLVATKQLLEGLTDWSQGRITEEEVSDIYVRLGNCFNAAVAAFTKEGISMRDLKEVPALLRTRLEDAINEEASRETLNKHLPRIRPIVLELLRGLRQKQEQHAAMVAAAAQAEPASANSTLDAMPQYTRRPSGTSQTIPNEAVASTSRLPQPDLPASRSREDLAAIHSAPDGRASPAPSFHASNPTSRPSSRNAYSNPTHSENHTPPDSSSGRRTPYEESTRRPSGSSGSQRRPGSLLKSSSSSSSLRPNSRIETQTPPPPPDMALPPLPTQKDPKAISRPLPVPGNLQHLQPPRQDISATPPVIRTVVPQESPGHEAPQQLPYNTATSPPSAFSTPPRSSLRPASFSKKDGDDASLEALKKADPLARRASKRFSAYTFNKISSSTSIAGSPSSSFQTTFPPTPGRSTGLDRDHSARDFVNAGGFSDAQTPEEPARRKSKSKSSPRPKHRDLAEPPVPALPPLSSLQKLGINAEDVRATPRKKRVSMVTEETEDELAADNDARSADNSFSGLPNTPFKTDRRPSNDELLRVDRSGSAVSLASSVSQYSNHDTEQGSSSRRASMISEPQAQAKQPKTIFLQLGRDMKKAKLEEPSHSTFAALRMLFTEKFAYNPGMSDFPAIYLRDPKSGIQYELEDLDEVKEGSVLSLNIEPLDQVKQHIDEGLATLARELKDLKVTMGRRMSMAAASAQGMIQAQAQSPAHSLSPSARQGDIPSDTLSLPQAAAPIMRSASSTSIKSNVTADKTEPTPDSPSPGAKSDTVPVQRLTAQLEASHAEVQSVRRELGILRQVYLDFRTETTGVLASLKAQTTHVKEIASTKIAGERAYIDEGKVKLDSRSQDLLTKIEELQDTIDDLKNDVVNRKIKPKPKQMDSIKASIASGQADLESLSQYIATVKPMWKKTWEAELQNIVDEQQLLNHQEELLSDLQADHENVVTVFDQIQQYVSLQSVNKIRKPEFRPPSPEEGHQGLRSVMLEVKGLAPASDKRMKAIEMAEKNRQKEGAEKTDEFAEELSGFVEGKMLKKTGGAEEIERIRQIKSEASLRAMFSQSGSSTPSTVPPVPPVPQQPPNPGLGLSNSEPLTLSGPATPTTPVSPLSPLRPLSLPDATTAEEKPKVTPPQLQLEVAPSNVDTGSLEPSPVYSLPEDVDPGDSIQWKLS